MITLISSLTILASRRQYRLGEKIEPRSFGMPSLFVSLILPRLSSIPEGGIYLELISFLERKLPPSSNPSYRTLVD